MRAANEAQATDYGTWPAAPCFAVGLSGSAGDFVLAQHRSRDQKSEQVIQERL
jgi:hypothetical protein